MVRPGKERAEAPADDDDAATQVTTQDSRWRAGVNRQAQQEAQQHQNSPRQSHETHKRGK